MTSVDPERFDPRIVHFEFPDELGESIQLAELIAGAVVIAVAKLQSIEPRAFPLASSSLGYEAALRYRYEVVQYLKGEGRNGDELTVRVGSGAAASGLDVFYHRTKEAAEELADNMLSEAENKEQSGQEALLFLQSKKGRSDYNFPPIQSNRYKEFPVIGETWLPAVGESTYQLNIPGEPSASISIEELESLIQIVAPLTRDYTRCVSVALSHRQRVRAQFLGEYRTLGITGAFEEPQPFRRKEVTLEYPVDTDSLVVAIATPPYRTPRFSHYWLDGKDKDSFEIYVHADLGNSLEGFVSKGDLPPGEYSVLFSSYHTSLPCDAPQSTEHTWWSKDTTEWIIRVVAP